MPVRVADRLDSRFLLDTGIGVNLITPRLLARLGLAPNGRSFVGRRMSGQTVEAPLFTLPSLEVGPVRRESAEAGEFDLFAGIPELSDIDGILSLGFFAERPVTVRPRRGVLAFSDDPGAHKARAVPVRVERDGPSVTMFLDLTLPNGERVRTEVDTGSDILILDRRFMTQLGIDPQAPGVDHRTGKDETGYTYHRYRAEVNGRVSVAAEPTLAVQNPQAMFQEIIYDGLVGTDILERYDVTYDVGRSRMLFAEAEGPVPSAPER